MRLFVDVGNSRLKWATREKKGAWLNHVACEYTPAELDGVLRDAWVSLPEPERVVVCSVAGVEIPQIIETVTRGLWGKATAMFHASASCAGVRNGYRNPETLGPDRWAALIGAHNEIGGPLCVVDCGTAVTVDALAADGEFLGGTIFPGLTLLRSGLSAGTAGAGSAAGDADDCVARSTADAVAAGTLYGLAGAVERLVTECRNVLGADMRVVLTGGNAPALNSLFGFESVSIPDLVLRGLAVAEDEC
jgi:type III pantothenate kinase